MITRKTICGVFFRQITRCLEKAECGLVAIVVDLH